MSAEVLREAAALMRSRAEAASKNPSYLNDVWEYVGGEQGDGLVWGVAQVMGDPVAGSSFPNVSAHIASWHPPVALAVADWLDHTNRTWSFSSGEDRVHALAVARAYLGSDR